MSSNPHLQSDLGHFVFSHFLGFFLEKQIWHKISNSFYLKQNQDFLTHFIAKSNAFWHLYSKTQCFWVFNTKSKSFSKPQWWSPTNVLANLSLYNNFGLIRLSPWVNHPTPPKMSISSQIAPCYQVGIVWTFWQK